MGKRLHRTPPFVKGASIVYYEAHCRNYLSNDVQTWPNKRGKVYRYHCRTCGNRQYGPPAYRRIEPAS